MAAPVAGEGSRRILSACSSNKEGDSGSSGASGGYRSRFVKIDA